MNGVPVNSLIVLDDGRQVLMFGDYVGLVWQTEERKETRPVTLEDGRSVEATVTYHERKGGASVGFLSVNMTAEEVYWAEDDLSVAGGLGADEAEQVAAELVEAALYLRSQEGGPR